MATQTEIAQHLDLSQASVAKLVSLKIFTSSGGRGGLDYTKCRVAYIQHLRKSAAGRSGDLTLTEQRTRHAKESADKLMMQNEMRRGEILEIAPVVQMVGNLLASVRTRLMAIPAERAPSLMRAKTAVQMQDALLQCITEALEAISSGVEHEIIKSAPNAKGDDDEPPDDEQNDPDRRAKPSRGRSRNRGAIDRQKASKNGLVT